MLVVLIIIIFIYSVLCLLKLNILLLYWRIVSFYFDWRLLIGYFVWIAENWYLLEFLLFILVSFAKLQFYFFYRCRFFVCISLIAMINVVIHANYLGRFIILSAVKLSVSMIFTITVNSMFIMLLNLLLLFFFESFILNC